MFNDMINIQKKKGEIMEKIKQRKEIAIADQWDLQSLFQSDEEYTKKLATMDEQIAHLATYQGHLHDIETLYAYLKESDQVAGEMMDLYAYAHLRQSENTADPHGQKMYMEAYSKYVSFISTTSFFTPELLSLDESTLQMIEQSKRLEEYAFYLKKIIRQKEHTLSLAEEKILAQMQEVFGAPSDISSALMNADMVFEDAKDQDGQMHQVTSSSYISLQTSHDQVLRRNAFVSLYKGYQQHIHTFAATYATQVKVATLSAKLRHFDSSLQASLFDDHIDQSVYDGLIDAVHRHMPTMHGYLALRKRLLKLNELHYYDVYAPLVQNDIKTYSFDEAKQMMLEALAPLKEDYIQVVKNGLASRWIDIYPNVGKRSGAFSSGTYHSNPYILLNYTGTLDAVSTLCHEMGHSMHTYLTNQNQPLHYSDYSLFIAEVASTVNENLLIEHLLQKETDLQRRLALLNQYMEGFKGTIFRQTMFAEFEKKMHASCEKGEALTFETMNQTYHDLIRQYFGDDFIIDEQVQYEWARIPHFYRPFYVYVYATGYASASSIAQKILNDDAYDVEQYLQFLKLGSSVYPLDALKVAGIDLTTSKPIDDALEKFACVLQEANEIATKLGY